MERRKNPIPEIIGNEPDAMHGDFLDNLTTTVAHASASRGNSLEALGADNFRGFMEPQKTDPAKDFNRFRYGERIAFDKAFPPEEIERFLNAGRDDPVEVFEALKAFDFADVRPEARDIVLAHFSRSRFAPQINMLDGENNTLMVYRNRTSIVALLRTAQDVFSEIIDLFTDEVKKGMDRARSAPKNPERDWEK